MGGDTMSHDYSENILIQESAGHLLERELGWEVIFAYNTEKLGENDTLGQKNCKEILKHIRLSPRPFATQTEERRTGGVIFGKT